MRILVAGPGRALAMWRPVAWALHSGHDVRVVEEHGGKAVFTPLVGASSVAQRLAVPVAVPNAEPGNCTGSNQDPVERVRALADQFRPDIIHAHHLSQAGAWCTDAGLQPLVVSVWGALNPLLEGAPPSALSVSVRRMLAAAGAVIVESPALVDVCRPLVAPATRVELIPLGADMQRFSPNLTAQRRAWRKALQISEDTVALLSPRGWGRIYRHEQVVEALGLAQPRLRRPVVLVFTQLGRNEVAGEADGCIAHVRRRAAELGLTGTLRWTPSVVYELMPSLYALADVVINYPAGDAFPSTLVEAAACERTIITARLPSYAGTFVEEFCTLVEPQQPAALAEAIVEAVNRPPAANAEQLRRARQVVVAQYDERIAQDRLMTLYHEMAAHP